MLTNEASRISPITSCLAAKARRVRGVFETALTQLGVFNNAVSQHVGDRDLCRGNQVVPRIPLELERVFSELG